MDISVQNPNINNCLLESFYNTDLRYTQNDAMRIEYSKNIYQRIKQHWNKTDECTYGIDLYSKEHTTRIYYYPVCTKNKYSQYEDLIDDNEVALIYSLEHELLKENNELYYRFISGNEEGVSVDSDTEAYHIMNSTPNIVIVNLHNHPKGTNISMDDIMFFIKHQTLKLMIVLPNDGGLYYIIKNDEYNRYNNICAFADIVESIAPICMKDGAIDMEKLTTQNMIDIAKEYIKNSIKYGVDYAYVKESNFKKEDYKDDYTD